MERLSTLQNALPLIAYSFSSRGFPDVVQRVQQALPSVKSAYLLSLFDVCYLRELRSALTSLDERIRIWDSGGYEKRVSDDVSSVISAVPSTSPWEAQHYIDVATAIPWNGKDILVSFDNTPPLPVPDQLEIAFACYDQISGGYLRDVLIHVQANYDVYDLVELIAPVLSKIDIIGFTEKEIAPTWKQGVRFVHTFRQAIEQLGLTPPPIHLFGCLDPKSVIYFTLAGVSIFDGLSWLRFFFNNRTTLYRREFEFLGDFQGIPATLDIDAAITLHNIKEMEELRSDLTYQLLVADDMLFGYERRVLQKLLA